MTRAGAPTHRAHRRNSKQNSEIPKPKCNFAYPHFSDGPGRRDQPPNRRYDSPNCRIKSELYKQPSAYFLERGRRGGRSRDMEVSRRNGMGSRGENKG
jgi:hypothetical protein